jgi:hypothetical protein
MTVNRKQNNETMSMMLAKKTWGGMAVLAAASLVAVSTQAGAIVVGDGWHGFGVESEQNSAWDTTFTFTLTSSALLKVTDMAAPGEQFNVYERIGAGPTTLLGETSTPGTGTAIPAGQYDTAFASSYMSHGEWTLGPGTYTITGTLASATTLPKSLKDGGLELAAVPEPQTYGLAFGSVALALGAVRRFRRA